MAASDYTTTIFDRATGELEQERFADSGVSYHGYRNAPGRVLNFLLFTRRWFAKVVGFFLRRRSSTRMIESFVAQNRVQIDELEKPLADYESFNEFFARKLTPGARPIDPDEDALIAPADSKVTTYRIDRNLVVPIKGKTFTLDELVGGKVPIDGFEDGLCIVFRLGPGDYHRFCYIDDGEHAAITSTGGRLHSVQPFVLEQSYPVFAKNYREITLLKTRRFGDVVHIDVGAMIIGKIVQHRRGGGRFEKGEEKGYFEAGSTIVLLLTKDAAVVDEDILAHTAQHIETRVRYGSRIGSLRRRSRG